MFAAQKKYFSCPCTHSFVLLFKTIAFYLEEACVPLPDRLLVVAGVLLQEVDILLGQLLLHTTRTHHRKK